jgi:hypothetical protein
MAANCGSSTIGEYWLCCVSPSLCLGSGLGTYML